MDPDQFFLHTHQSPSKKSLSIPEDTEENFKHILYSVTQNVWVPKSFNPISCSSLPPLDGPVYLNVAIELIGKLEDPQETIIESIIQTILTTLYQFSKGTTVCLTGITPEETQFGNATFALSFEPIQEPLKVLLAGQNIGRLSSLQLDVLFEARRHSHPLSFTESMKQLTFNLICDLMNHLATEIPLVFNSKWRKSLPNKLATIIYMSTYTASIADSAKDEEARSEVGKMPVVSES
ncbi:uncharacterized protein PGTG_15269 [Puccinia graminis f. sp. tritici CRL 75-36-700-3]|uniref:Uncharacterized protein n=1 Tax=Puccinia graminis f. sp. tritici (strain CRL 75-36-700-3 / race SCCL) TaxID=418459 RepID=E3KYN1_PUCGT|nr:uncharacterized protein PGTG_15269 [Puccinia graminis f. sp. tritici CRL 75-36-700-3]EFP89427.2 hypothetical protein PGTG_15269 [Puccinia graminis f. sp. tritici CRL 75-36-700-3]